MNKYQPNLTFPPTLDRITTTALFGTLCIPLILLLVKTLIIYAKDTSHCGIIVNGFVFVSRICEWAIMVGIMSFVNNTYNVLI